MNLQKNIIKEAREKINNAQSLFRLNQVFREYLGANGEISKIFKSLRFLSGTKRNEVGQKANLAKKKIKEEIKKRKIEIKDKEAALSFSASGRKIDNSYKSKRAGQRTVIDITRPGKKFEGGHLHPLTVVQTKIEEIFQSMGFSVAQGPEVESEWYNFDALNMPKIHPARDMQDTLWIKEESKNNFGKKANSKNKLLMRTQTSPVQIRYMEKHNPPLRIIAPGRVFRNEATDTSHEVQFYQCEGLMVNKSVSVANFKAVIQEFLKRFFKKEIKIRLRPGYFPFTEPGFEIDIACQNCGGKGCKICKYSGWIETLGAGMVHPNVFKAVGYNPKNWQGFAFGMGVDRLAMIKYKINDIRLFYSSDLRFLKQF